MISTLLTAMNNERIPMQHDGMYALMSWRDIGLHKQMKNSSMGGEGWLLLLVFALWLPLLFLA